MPEPDDDDPRSILHAADEPTAMWDEDSLQGLGLDGDRVSSPPAGPATHGSGQGGPSVQISVGGGKKAGLSWAITIGLALALGVGVYFLVRMLR